MKVYLSVDPDHRGITSLYVKSKKFFTTFEKLMNDEVKTQSILTDTLDEVRIFRTKKDAVRYMRVNKIVGMTARKRQ